MPHSLKIKLRTLNDPATITKLSKFIEKQTKKGIFSWKKDTIYTFPDKTKFSLDEDLYWRARKNNKEGIRCQTKGYNLAAGTFGSVSLAPLTLAFGPNAQNFQIKQQGKDGRKRIVKVQKHDPINPETLSIEALLKEYEFTRRAGHLHIKKPTIIKQKDGTYISYTFMDEAPGVELFKLMNQYPLNGIELLRSIKAVISAIKTQATDKGIVHRDIKPENIILKLDEPIEATLVDYGLAMFADKQDNLYCGTAEFVAPETCKGNAGLKSDVYSLGRLISELCGVDISDQAAQNISHIKTEDRRILLSGIFDGVTGLSTDIQKDIKNLLLGMLAIDPNNRLSIYQVEKKFDVILKKAQAELPAEARFEQAIQPLSEIPEEKPLRASVEIPKIIPASKDEKIQSSAEAYITALKKSSEQKGFGMWFDKGRKIALQISDAETWVFKYGNLKERIQKIQMSQASNAYKGTEILRLSETFYTELSAYNKKVLSTSPCKKVIQSFCAFVGTMLGGLIGATLGAIGGIAIGAALGSVAPYFGNLVGAVVTGTKGAVEGALFGAGIGAAIAGGCAAYVIKNTSLSPSQIQATKFISGLDEVRQGIEQNARMAYA